MKSLFKDTFREIKKTKGRFFSILGIVLIGVAFFSGVWASAPMMRYSVDDYYDDYNLMDFRILSNFGITEDDVKEIRKIDGVSGVYPAYTKDFLGQIGNDSYVIKVSTFNQNDMINKSDDYINQFKLVEGRYPEKPNEVLFEKAYTLQKQIEVGDKVKLSVSRDEEIEDFLNETEYEVVGLIETPFYLSFEKGTSNIGGGVVNYYMYINEDNFNMDVYTDAFVTIDGAKQFNSYNDEYFDYLLPYKNAFEDLGYVQSEIRRNDIMSEAETKLKEAEDEYKDGLNTFNEEIKKAEKQIQDGKDQIIISKAKIDASELVLESQVQSGRMQLEMYEDQLKLLQDEYNKLQDEFNKNNETVLEERAKAQKELDELKVEIETLKKEAQPLYDEIAQVEADLKVQQDLLATNKETVETNKARIDEIDVLLEGLESTDEEYIKLVEEKTKLQSDNLAIETSNIEIQVQITTLETKLLELNSNPDLLEIENKENDALLLEKEIQAIDDSLEISSGLLTKLKEQINKMNQTISNAKIEIDKQEREGRRQIEDGRRQIAQAEQDIVSGKVKLEEERAKGQAELDDANEQIIKAKNDISRIENAHWYVLDRHSHYSYMDYGGACDRMQNIAVVFPVFFFLVAALVCLTTMTRLVDEQRTQIGTLKALGYTTFQISSKYIIYAVLASLIGGILGLAIGIFLFPYILYTAWGLAYTVPPIQYEIQWHLIIITLIISVSVTTGATLFACYKELVATPSSLMRPKAPKLGKKILLEKINFLWSRLSFTMKVTARNIFRYKKRMSMTIIGIAGCTSLLIAGFGIKDSISDLVNVQFTEIIKYDGVIKYEDGLDVAEKNEVVSLVDSNSHIKDSFDVYSSNVKLVDFDNKEIQLVVTNDTERFKDFYDLRTRKKHTPVDLTSDGVIITEKIANDHNIKIGDKITIENADQFVGTVEVKGIVEQYVNHTVYMTASCYENMFELKPKNNSFLVKLDDLEFTEDVTKQFINNDLISACSFNKSFISTFEDMINSLNYIVLVLIISAGALAFVVLYNLTNVNISERQREIATLKVLGFYPKEVRKYIYYENFFLTLLGGLVGLLMGKGLHYIIMVVVELEDIMFGRNINPISFVYSFGLTILFTLIVNKVMDKKLKNIQMVESLKSVE